MLDAIQYNLPYIESLIKTYSRIYKIPYSLIKAIVRVESNFNPVAQAYEKTIDKYAYGLMQILIDTAKQVTKTDITGSSLFDPNTNIKIGTKYLRMQLDRYGQDRDSAIAAYNAGTAKRKMSGEFINQGYVDKVNNYRRIYAMTDFNKLLPFIIAIVITSLILSKRKK